MRDITRKDVSLRRATAEAEVRMAPESIEAIRSGTLPKGDIVGMTRATAMLGLKRTPELLPFCHTIPLDGAEVEVQVEDDRVLIRVSAAAIARTGVEVEAMTGAAIAALNVYDMVKPIDPTASVGSVRVLSKRGGKSDRQESFDRVLRAGILVASDSVAAGTKHDRAGRAVRQSLEDHDLEIAADTVLPDEPDQIAEQVRIWCDDDGLDLAVVVGGTGLGPRDRTPEALRPLFDREIPGIAEAMRSHGRQRTPLADLSRSLAGQRGTTVILGLPGSTGGATESMDALMPWLLHIVKVFDKAYRHGE